MLENKILPIDLEWVWSDGKPWIIDFGECYEVEHIVDNKKFLTLGGSQGLNTDFYWPHEGHRGHQDFLAGYGDCGNRANCDVKYTYAAEVRSNPPAF